MSIETEHLKYVGELRLFIPSTFEVHWIGELTLEEDILYCTVTIKSKTITYICPGENPHE
ncbi:hypothetical protein LguiB_031282 [Lonicera macranthoides]